MTQQSNNWSNRQRKKLEDRGTTTGTPDGSFKINAAPNVTVTCDKRRWLSNRKKLKAWLRKRTSTSLRCERDTRVNERGSSHRHRGCDHQEKAGHFRGIESSADKLPPAVLAANARPGNYRQDSRSSNFLCIGQSLVTQGKYCFKGVSTRVQGAPGDP